MREINKRENIMCFKKNQFCHHDRTDFCYMLCRVCLKKYEKWEA